MEFLSLEYIKSHSRIDFSCDDDLLEMYADSAEETLAQYLNRGKSVSAMVQSLTQEYGKLPANIYRAALLLTEEGYNHRSPTSAQQMYIIGYGFDVLVKPYMIL